MTRQVKPHQSIVLRRYAECLVEVGGASAIPEAARYVDMVREREKEICFEYDRLFDLRRWGLGTDEAFTNEVKARSTKFKDNFTKGKEWLPIPRSDVDNNPNLTQNEGY